VLHDSMELVAVSADILFANQSKMVTKYLLYLLLTHFSGIGPETMNMGECRFYFSMWRTCD